MRTIVTAAAAGLALCGIAMAQQTPSPTPPFPLQQWVSFPPDVTENISAITTAANTIFCTVAISQGAQTASGIVPHIISGVGFRINAAASGGNIQWAIYSDVNGYPGTLQAKTASFSTTAAGVASGGFANNALVPVGGSGGGTIGNRFWRCFNQDATAGGVATYYAASNSLTFLQLVGTATVGNAFASAVPPFGITCSGVNCAGGSSTFNTWPASLVGSAWSDNGTAARSPVTVWQVLD